MRNVSMERGEWIQQLLIGCATLLALFLSVRWPTYTIVIWAVFFGAIAFVLFLESRKPVNYESIVILDDSIEYTAFGEKSIIQLSDIKKLQFVREEALFPDVTGPYIESKWVAHMREGNFMEIMDEWPHRRQLMRIFEKRLIGFNTAAAKSGFKASKEGVWLCFES